jgi:2-methylcitrate dehydratase PrpD
MSSDQGATLMSIAEKFDNDPGHRPLTAEIAAWLAGVKEQDITPAARTWAKHALLDWFGVTVAGASEPLVDILVELYGQGEGGATIVGRSAMASLENAVLINGATSHALDYDDVNGRLGGHPTVPVAPVALALAETLGASGQDVLTAIVAGTEVECLIGDMAGRGHYEQGFHATATIGTFGAAATAAKMLGLDEGQIRHALGIAASQAAGLKSNFGTMTKPLHAGKAAMNGLMAARLAQKGFTANEAILECAQGTADVMMPGFEAGFTSPNPPGTFAIEQTLFKYHAACYLTHASIDAINELRAAHGIGLDDLKKMTLHVQPGHFTVCNIPDPKTGLEIKFSIRHCAAMALAGIDTSALETYSDANAVDAKLGAARAKVEVTATDKVARHAARVVIELNDGRTLEAESDAGIPAADIAAQWTKLSGKFDVLCKPVIGDNRTTALRQGIVNLETATSIGDLMQAAR